jgi:septal ring factor EnvC (AmiA/AmiB activator)
MINILKMKAQLLILMACFLSLQFLSYGQDNPSPVMTEAQIQQMKEVQKKVEKAEKKVKKSENAEKKAEKEAKQQKKLKNAIRDTKRSIANDERTIVKLKEKLSKDGAKGKLAPKDVDQLNKKIEKLTSRIAKDQQRLKKLEKK